MGRTMPSATQAFMQEEQAFARFRRALRRADQLALDDLFASAQKHLAVVAYASHSLPFEAMLLAMLLEEHKLVMQLRQKLVELASMLRSIEAADGGVKPPRLEIPTSKLEPVEEAPRSAEQEPVEPPERVQYVPVEE